MTTFAGITDTETGHKKPLTVSLIRRLRDNLFAMFEGAPGAPRLWGLGVGKIADVPVLTVTAANTYDLGYAATVVVGTVSTGSASYVLSHTITVIGVTGTVRFKLTHAVSDGTTASQLVVRKNGVDVQTWSQTGNTSGVARSADIAVVPGDVVEWLHRRTAGAGTVSVNSRAETASDGYTTIAPLIPWSLA